MELTIDSEVLTKILVENKHQSKQITDLQQLLTLKEELLRAHRRVELSDSQHEKLTVDLEETAKSVQDRYKQST